MKKLFFLFVFLCSSFVLFSESVLGATLTRENITTQEVNCNGGSWNRTFYLGDTRYFYDIFSGDVQYDWTIGFNSSRVKIYNPFNALNINGNFVFRSNIKPAGVADIIVASNNSGTVISGHAPIRTTLAAQIVYSITRKYNNGYISNSPASYTYTLPDWSSLTKNYTSKPNFNSSVQQDNECVNIYVNWCGDGALDTANGEQCDLGAQNGQPGSACSATCTPVTPPVNPYSACVVGNPVANCNTNTYLTQAACLLANPAGSGRSCYLNDIASCNATRQVQCPVANLSPACTNLTATPTSGAVPLTVNFTGTGTNLGTVSAYRILVRDSTGSTIANLTGSTATYVFNTLGTYTAQLFIDGTNGSGGTYTGLTSPACTTGNITVALACIPGTLTGPQLAPVTATSPGLCPAGQTVGGFTSTVAGRTTTYIWSCNGSPVGGACSATFTTGGGDGLTCTPGNFTRDVGGVVPAPISVTTPGLCPPTEVVGNFTDATNGSSHRYSWSCNTISAGTACTAFYNGGGTGGGGSSCRIGTISGVQSSPITLTTPGLCEVGYAPTNLQTSQSNGTIVYTWSCGDVSGCMSTYAPSPITVPGSSSYCGNGVVERPNSRGVYESCDTPAPWCVRGDGSCTIASTNPGAIDPGKLTITTPGNSSLDIATYQLIIGNDVSVFSPKDIISFETHTPMYLDRKTATITNNSSLITGTTLSKLITGGVGGMLRMDGVDHKTYDGSGNLLTWTITYDQKSYQNSIQLFNGSELQGLKGDTSIISGSYLDTNLTLPMSIGSGLYASLQYLESPFRIRVSKPIIGNTAGGSAFIGSALGNSVNTVVWTFFNNLRSGNFTTSTVNTNGSYALSSATNSVSDNQNLSQKISNGSNSEEGSILRSSTGFVANNTTVNIASELDIDAKSTKLGDTANIRVFKDANVSIDAELSLVGVKTVIVENGNLTINKDMVYANKTSSLAWIVKNGNIIIADTVKNIAGVYVTLAGSIESNGKSTANRLTVDGSLYGNTTDLVNNRSYVRGQTGYSALNVGVIVNYSNRAIMYPPPFLSRFLDQYSLQRVAR